MNRRLRLRASLVLAFAAVAAGGPLPPTRADETTKNPRVAMADFTADDNLTASAEGAAQWSVLTQAALAGQEPDVQWIERAQLQLAAEELHLSTGGFTSAAGSLRAGRWLKADLAILGRFTRNEHDDDGHTLRLEIVDLDHADTLAVRTIPVPGDRRETISPDDGPVRATVAALHDALAEARAAMARHAGRRVIAPLFVRNADPSPRLDKFGSDVIDALTRGADRSADLRALRFPQADRTRDEAELVVGGFTEADVRRHVADLYVWGTYRELPAPGTAFAQTPVEIDLTLWDGAYAPEHLTERTTVAELPALTQKLADRCLDAARRLPADRAALPPPASDETCRSVAGLLRDQGVRLAAVLDSYQGQRAAFLNTPEGKKTAAQARLLLETACFFQPDDRAAQAARLRAQWGGFPLPAYGLPLLDAWRCANEVVTVAERFEAAGDGSGDFRRARLDLDVYLLDRLDVGETDLHQPRNERNLPADVSDATLTTWHGALDGRFARDAEAFVRSPSARDVGVEIYDSWLRALFRRVHDPAQGMRVLEAFWPAYAPLYRRDPKKAEEYFRLDDDDLAVKVRKLALRQHQSEQGETLLAALSSGNAPAPPASAPDAAPTPAALTVLTPVVRTPRYTAPSPAPDPAARTVTNVLPMWRDPRVPPEQDINVVPRYTVHSLTLDGDGAVWMSVLREKGITSELTPVEESQDLVRFEPGAGTFRRLPVPGLAARPPVAAVLPMAGGGVWLAQDFVGILRYDPAAAAVTRRYTVADGLATANVDGGITDGDGRCCLVGHEHGVALVQQYDPARQEWLRVSHPPADGAAGAEADGSQAFMAPAAQLASCGRWLLIGLGENWTLFDRESGQARDLRDLLARVPPFRPTGNSAPGEYHAARALARSPRQCAADAGGFWLTAGGSIIRLDPAHPEAARFWPLPAEMRLGITAMASDGEDLWVVGPSGKSHPPMQQPAPLAMQLPPMPGLLIFGLGLDGRGFVARLHAADGQWLGGFEVNERVSSLAVSRQTIYLGLTTAAQPLIEIDKESLRAARHDP